LRRRIGDVARSAGVGVETVRFYERQGLIDQPLKPDRGWREYGDGALLQLGYVRLAREMGLTLRDVKRLKAASAGNRAKFCTDVRETVAGRLKAVELKISELESDRARLSGWLNQCAKRSVSDECPLYAQLQRVAELRAPRSTKRPKR